MGFNLYEKTIGIIGTGNIGTAFARIMNGFGCKLLAVDPIQNETCKELNCQFIHISTDYPARKTWVSLLMNCKHKFRFL